MTAGDIVCELGSFAASRRFAHELAQRLEGGMLLVLSGPLGAGKTYLARAILRALGLPKSARVTSPTFGLVHEYDTDPFVLHVDLYRINSELELSELALLEERDRGRLLIVEWGEPYIELLGGDAIVVSLTLNPRRARVWGTGPAFDAVRAGFSG